MAILNNPEDFVSGENVTAAKLNNLVDGATFLGGAGQATDDSTLEVNDGVGGDGSLRVKDAGITTAKLADGVVSTQKIADSAVSTQKIADSAVTSGKIADGEVIEQKIADGAVTFAKLQNIQTAKVIGRITASSGVPEEVSILDQDAMTDDSDTALATQQSIKAYVDSKAGLGASSWTEGSISSATELQAPDNSKSFAGIYVRSNQCNWNETATVYYYTDETTIAETFYIQGAGDGGGSVRTSSLLLVPLYTNASGNKVVKISWSNMAVISGRYWI